MESPLHSAIREVLEAHSITDPKIVNHLDDRLELLRVQERFEKYAQSAEEWEDELTLMFRRYNDKYREKSPNER